MLLSFHCDVLIEAGPYIHAGGSDTVELIKAYFGRSGRQVTIGGAPQQRSI